MKPVYVLTRNGRRADPNNYFDKKVASYRFSKLVDQVSQYDNPKHNIIKIVKTSSPHLIR